MPRKTALYLLRILWSTKQNMNRHLIHYLRSPEVQSINYGSVGMRSEDSGPCSEIPSLYHPKQKLTFKCQDSPTKSFITELVWDSQSKNLI